MLTSGETALDEEDIGNYGAKIHETAVLVTMPAHGGERRTGD